MLNYRAAIRNEERPRDKDSDHSRPWPGRIRLTLTENDIYGQTGSAHGG
jgi:hypothetical protein